MAKSMTIIELHNRFSIILDKEGSPDVIDTEFTSLINTAQLAVVKGIVEGELKNKKAEEMPPHAFENVSHLSERIAPLIYPISTATVGNTGHVLYSTINAFLPTTFYHIASVARLEAGTYYFCRFLRLNDRYKHELNSFKKPDVTHPVYMLERNQIQTLPITASVAMKLVVIRNPKDINFDEDTPGNNIDPELPDNTMQEVLFRALILAAVSIREPSLHQAVVAEEKKAE